MPASDVWYGRSTTARLASAALTPASWLYALCWEAYEAAYAWGLKRPAEPHRPVLCVGSLSVGGSGKTPVACHVAEVLLRIGRQVVLSASGYRSPAESGASVAPVGPLSAREWGDEPALIRWLLPEVPLIVGRDRVRAAKLCNERFPGAVLVLDDGFQHLRLEKHLSLVLDEPNPPNRRCLPAGPYREPRGGLSRADLVLPGKFQVESRIAGFSLHGEADLPEGEWQGRPVSVLCALGRPDRFLSDLESLGLLIERKSLFGDHDPLDEGNLLQAVPEDFPVVVSGKDWQKLRERPDVRSRAFWIARHEVRVTPESEFEGWLRDGLA